MPKVIASLSVLAGIYLVLHVHAQEAGGEKKASEKPAKAKADSCTIPMSLFIPSFKKAIEKETPADSKIRRAALEVLSGQLQKGTVKVSWQVGDVKKSPIQSTKVEPAKGEVVLDGITWEWEVTAPVSAGQRFVDANPVWAHFRLDARFTISSRAVTDANFIQVVCDDDTRETWFYIVAGAGKDQDAAKAPKNAPTPDK